MSSLTLHWHLGPFPHVLPPALMGSSREMRSPLNLLFCTLDNLTVFNLFSEDVPSSPFTSLVALLCMVSRTLISPFHSVEPRIACNIQGEATPSINSASVLLLWPVIYVMFNVPQNMVCSLDCQSTLLKSVELAVSQNFFLLHCSLEHTLELLHYHTGQIVYFDHYFSIPLWFLYNYPKYISSFNEVH